MAATTAFTSSGMSAFVRGVSSADLSPSSDIAPRIAIELPCLGQMQSQEQLKS